jgi:molecular chaperone DnaJ
MAQGQDYYEILGVDRNATQDQIKRAFRRLARRHHPDVSPEDPEAEARFREIAEAYQALSDPERRAQYDLYGRVGPAGPLAGDIWEELSGLGGLFEAFFGPRAPAHPRLRPGADLRYDLEVELAEVATGVEKRIVVERLRACDTCQGTGSRSKSGPQPCPTCRGSGQTRHTAATPFGHLSTVSTCAQCGGAGTVMPDPCPDCRGSGRRAITGVVPVKIPAGVEHGATLRLHGEGESGERGARAGDLYVVVHVKPHEIFERQGRDLQCVVPIAFTTAALGGVASVPTLAGGTEELTIPPGTQTGETFTLLGLGLPDAHTEVRGSLHVTVRVVTPAHLTPRQQDLLSEFAREGGNQVDVPRGWFARLRDALRGEEGE